MLLAADSGGSFTVAPSLELTLWTAFVIVVALVVTALLLYLLVLLAIYLRRERARKS